ncbi:MAG: PriCT-2 domain-containing protein, partial [Coriobacteriia bacterium]
MIGTDDLQMALDAIDPAALDYDSWLRVGMACAHEGLPLSAWESWSRRDGARFHEGECARKWAGFRGSASPVTGRTIYRIARDQGNWPPLGWDSDHELYTALDAAHAAWSDEDAERWLDLQCSSFAEEIDATDEEIAARQAAIDALDDALRAKYPPSEHERQSTKDAQERDLPPLVPFSSVMDDLPELAPELIAGTLR